MLTSNILTLRCQHTSELLLMDQKNIIPLCHCMVMSQNRLVVQFITDCAGLFMHAAVVRLLVMDMTKMEEQDFHRLLL